MTLLAHQNTGKENRYRKIFFATLISTLGRFNRANKKKSVIYTEKFIGTDVLFDPTQDHTSDDHDEEREDTKLLLNFCVVQRQLIQTHNSILTLYKEEQGSGEEPWKGKSKELVRSVISWVKQVTVDREFSSHTRAQLGFSKECCAA